MPFQDIDEPAVAVPRSPNAVERWLHRLFIEDWNLKLLALAITLVAWLAVAGVNKPVTIRASIPLHFIRPDEVDISNDPPKSVDVILTGTQHLLERINFINLVATVNLSDYGTGLRVVRLSQDRVDIDLPNGVKIESFQPSTIQVRIEPMVDRQLEVEVRLGGKPADGYEVYKTRASQPSIRVRGPASHVDSLPKALTETISVDGRKETFTASHVAIDIPDHQVDVLDPIIDVTVEIGERRSGENFNSFAHAPSQF